MSPPGVEMRVELHGLVGTLHHGPSGATLRTVPPKDNGGDGSSFSPTDLLAVSLANADFMDITGAGAASWTGTSLGDPIGSRLVLAPDAQYRVGHAYKPVVWAMARYTAADVHPDDQALNDARATLACGDVPTLISAISEPLTVQRFFTNITLAPKLTLLRIPVDPAEARATLC